MGTMGRGHGNQSQGYVHGLQESDSADAQSWWRAIVNLASINGIRGNNRLVAYAATKGGVVAMTMSLALDHVAENIRVNCVCPATIETDMVRQMLAEAPDLEAATRSITAKHPIGRMAQPEEVASTIAFLASSDASFMTGLAIPVDGGRSIR